MLSIVSNIPDNWFLIIGGDLNDQVVTDSDGFEEIHGGYGYGIGNDEAMQILDLFLANQLDTSSIFFAMQNNQLLTCKCSIKISDIYHILVRKCNLTYVQDTRIITSEECITKHKLLVTDVNIKTTRSKPITLPPHTHVWKLKDIIFNKSFNISGMFLKMLAIKQLLALMLKELGWMSNHLCLSHRMLYVVGPVETKSNIRNKEGQCILQDKMQNERNLLGQINWMVNYLK